jgi:hypothetical protein
MRLADENDLKLCFDASMPTLWPHPLLKKRRNKAESPDTRSPRTVVLETGDILPCREEPCHVCNKALCPRCDVHEENVIRECNGSCLPHTSMICDECRLEECICKYKWEDMTVEDMLRGNKYPVLCAECVQVRDREAHLIRYIRNSVCEGHKHMTSQLRVLGRIVGFESGEVEFKGPVLFSLSLSHLASGLEFCFCLRFDSAYAVLSFLETALLPLQVVPKSFSFGQDEA